MSLDHWGKALLDYSTKKPSLKKKGGVVNDPSTSQEILSEVLSKWEQILKSHQISSWNSGSVQMARGYKITPTIICVCPMAPQPNRPGRKQELMPTRST